MSTNPCTDHLGNAFPSISAMCRHYGITSALYHDRKKHMSSLEEILTSKKKIIRNGQCVDHKGNVFKSKTEMCKAYNVNTATFDYRKRHGYSLQKCLDPENLACVKIKDHLGNEFNTQQELCDHYNISLIVFTNRKMRNWPLEKILTTPINDHLRVVDHKGNEFDSIDDMCRHYGVSRVSYDTRKYSNKTLEEALGVIPVIHKNISNLIVDEHLKILHCIIKYGRPEKSEFYVCEMDEQRVILHHDSIIEYYRKYVI